MNVRTRPIKHHNPSPGYKLLWTTEAYPEKDSIKALTCKHTNTADFWVRNSDPGWMNVEYKHTVCMSCGKLLKVNGVTYRKHLDKRISTKESKEPDSNITQKIIRKLKSIIE